MPRNRYGHRRIEHREDLLVVLPFQNQGIDPCLLSRRSEGDVRGLLSSLSAVLLLLTAILVTESVSQEEKYVEGRTSEHAFDRGDAGPCRDLQH